MIAKITALIRNFFSFGEQSTSADRSHTVVTAGEGGLYMIIPGSPLQLKSHHTGILSIPATHWHSVSDKWQWPRGRAEQGDFCPFVNEHGFSESFNNIDWSRAQLLPLNGTVAIPRWMSWNISQLRVRFSAPDTSHKRGQRRQLPQMKMGIKWYKCTVK